MEHRRQNIISKAFDLYHQYGIKSVSMDDIARELGMSKKTLYQSISDKYELVENVIAYQQEVASSILAVFHDASLNAIAQHWEYKTKIQERFPKYNPSFLYDLRKYYPMLLTKMNEYKLKVFYEANLSNLEQGKKEGFYLEDINSDIISRMLVGNAHFSLDPANGLFCEAEVLDKNTYAEIYKYHFRGICTAAGHAELKRHFNRVKQENVT
ncbi:TetR/AcrR family transcriptional regulator [Prolixibacteraceae bacterium Z1-6]|uniref:TetR/AcrR family transcriptional regulator n=1 Tax=Draconibacterium aestuarii TaxID=2998507 RepID=A0A9X3J5H7_9BACT|nr:TetR/AcrR family transcriptional regulator [Prolixibacteraceae bacterium Z1-6]